MDLVASPDVQLDRAALVWCPHPLTTRDREVIFEPPLQGERLHDYLQRVVPDVLNADCILYVGDREVPRQWWPYVRTKPGQIISARAIARDSGGGGEGGGSDVGRALGMIVIAVLSVYTAGVLGGGVYGAIGAMGVSIAGSMALNALFPIQQAKLPQLGGTKDSATYSLSGGSNKPRPMEPVAMVLGQHRMFPDFAGKPYTQIEGEDDYLYVLLDWGMGEPQISDLRIGDTPIGNYEEVQIWTARDALPVNWPTNVDSISGGELRHADGFMERTTSADTVRIAVDMSALVYRQGATALEGNSVVLQMEYRPVGGGDWLPLNRDPVLNYHTEYWSQGYWLTEFVDDQTGSSSGDADSSISADPGDGFPSSGPGDDDDQGGAPAPGGPDSYDDDANDSRGNDESNTTSGGDE